jgi:hypothetical protein
LFVAALGFDDLGYKDLLLLSGFASSVFLSFFLSFFFLLLYDLLFVFCEKLSV